MYKLFNRKHISKKKKNDSFKFATCLTYSVQISLISFFLKMVAREILWYSACSCNMYHPLLSLSLPSIFHFSIIILNSLSLYYSRLNILSSSHFISHQFLFVLSFYQQNKIVKLHVFMCFLCDVDMFKFPFYWILYNLNYLVTTLEIFLRVATDHKEGVPVPKKGPQNLMRLRPGLVRVKIGRMEKKERKRRCIMEFSLVQFRRENKRERKWCGK